MSQPRTHLPRFLRASGDYYTLCGLPERGRAVAVANPTCRDCLATWATMQRLQQESVARVRGVAHVSV